MAFEARASDSIAQSSSPVTLLPRLSVRPQTYSRTCEPSFAALCRVAGDVGDHLFLGGAPQDVPRQGYRSGNPHPNNLIVLIPLTHERGIGPVFWNKPKVN